MANYAIRRGELVMFLVPPTTGVGLPVTGAFHARDTTGRDRVLARVLTRSVRDARSDLIPLTPRFAARLVWDIAPGGGLVYSDGTAYSYRCYASDGALSLLVAVAVPPSRPVTRRDISPDGPIGELVGDTLVGSTPAALGSSPMNPVRGIATRHPAITDLRVLQDSTIAIRRVPPEASDSVDWDLWDPSGRLIGRTRLATTDAIVDGNRARLLIVSRPTTYPKRVSWVALRRS
jgi:hypothetical protein